MEIFSNQATNILGQVSPGSTTVISDVPLVLYAVSGPDLILYCDNGIGVSSYVIPSSSQYLFNLECISLSVGATGSVEVDYSLIFNSNELRFGELEFLGFLGAVIVLWLIVWILDFFRRLMSGIYD